MVFNFGLPGVIDPNLLTADEGPAAPEGTSEPMLAKIKKLLAGLSNRSNANGEPTGEELRLAQTPMNENRGFFNILENFNRVPAQQKVLADQAATAREKETIDNDYKRAGAENLRANVPLKDAQTRQTLAKIDIEKEKNDIARIKTKQELEEYQGTLKLKRDMLEVQKQDAQTRARTATTAQERLKAEIDWRDADRDIKMTLGTLEAELKAKAQEIDQQRVNFYGQDVGNKFTLGMSNLGETKKRNEIAQGNLEVNRNNAATLAELRKASALKLNSDTSPQVELGNGIRIPATAVPDYMKAMPSSAPAMEQSITGTPPNKGLIESLREQWLGAAPKPAVPVKPVTRPTNQAKPITPALAKQYFEAAVKAQPGLTDDEYKAIARKNLNKDGYQ